MVPNRLLFSAFCLAALISPQTLKSQTPLTVESLVASPYSRNADLILTFQSKDLDWKDAGNGRSKADVILVTASFDKRGETLTWSRQFLTVTSDTPDAAKLATATARLSAKIRIPNGTNKVRFLIDSSADEEIGAVEVDRKTIYAAATPDLPHLPCRYYSRCYP
jgi:hypothetical protein